MSATKTPDRKSPVRLALPKNYVILPAPLPLGKFRKVKTGRLVYEHCRNLLGQWDELRILDSIYFECGACKGRIDEHLKQQLALEAAERDEQRTEDSGQRSAKNKSVLCPQSSVLSTPGSPAPMLGWLPTAIGTPGVVSMHMNDLLSTDRKSSWGRIILELIAAKKESRSQIQGVVNNRFGNVWKEELAQTKVDDIRANVAGKDYFFLDVQTDQGTKREVFDSEDAAETARKVLLGSSGGVAGPGDRLGYASVEVGTVLPSFCKPYKRGNIPFLPQNLILGSDVGGNYARWVVIAVCPNMIDAAVIDWGDELDPESIAEIVLTSTWPCLADNKKRRIGYGFIDSHWRTNDVLRACWHVLQIGKSHRLIPTAMIGGTAARGMRVWTFHHIQGYRAKSYRHSAFKQLGYNFREAMNDTFITCIQKKRRRIWFPAELAQSDRDLDHDQRQFIEELCNDKMVEDRHGRKMWADPPPGPNHYGAALKNAVTGLRFLTRKHHLSARPGEEQPADAEVTSDL